MDIKNVPVGTSTPQNIYDSFATNAAQNQWLFFIGIIIILAGLLFFVLNFFAPQARKIIGFTSLGVGLVLIAIAAYLGSNASQTPVVFSKYSMLASLWGSYKETYIEASSGRTLGGDGITTSEGESYTMLRAAWFDDETTFDQSWQWTQTNLIRPDHLFSWLYGKKPDGTFGVLIAQNGQNSASDADSDIALSLLFAYSRWQKPEYLSAAETTIANIWKDEVVIIDGKPYLAADNLEKNSTNGTAVINPSYFAPYAYRLFAKVDPADPWMSLVDDSYAVIQESSAAALGGSGSVGLPPDWIAMDKTTGTISALDANPVNEEYGYDAMRVPWRLALDWEWNHDQRDKQILDQFSFLGAQWDEHGSLKAVYGHDGTVAANYEAPAIYGGDIGYFIVSDSNNAEAVYQKKLLILFDPNIDNWKIPLSYYDSNWAWFGLALYNNELPNLAQNIL